MTPIYGGPVEKIETLTYVPGLAGGTDLEAATKTISNTSENAVADYTSIHTLPAPTDSRIAVLRGCMRRSFTIDSVGGGCTTLNWRVKRGGVSVATGAIAVAGAPLTSLLSWDITTLITGAQTNTLFLWVDAGTCVISEVTMWTGVGSMNVNSAPSLSLTHTGMFSMAGLLSREGTGTFYHAWTYGLVNLNYTIFFRNSASPAISFGDLAALTNTFFCPQSVALHSGIPSVVTDLPYLTGIKFYLRSEQ